MSKKPPSPAVLIGRGVCREMFKHQALVMVPNTSWTGHECDVLVVTRELKLVDVEIKMSFADLKRDQGKDKWWKGAEWLPGGRERREWPPKVWKHWYVVSESAWCEGAAMMCSASNSSGFAIFCDGSGLVQSFKGRGAATLHIARNPKPNREAKPIGAAEAIDIARLASIRLWEEYMKQGNEPKVARVRHVLDKA